MKIKKDTKLLLQKIIATAVSMNRLGINVNKSGNVSVRSKLGGKDGFWITPSAIPYEKETPEDLVFIYKEGGQYHFVQDRKPSSEWLLHAAIYENRSDINAVVHTHSCMATVVSCLDEPIPAFHYMVAALGGKEISCAKYATMGTQELADNCVAALGTKMGCLLSHHGVVACAKSLPKALANAVEIENLAKMWVELKKLGGFTMIEDEEMDRIVEKFKTHGQTNDR